MNTNPSKFDLDKGNYKIDHGSKSLQPFVDRTNSRLVVVKHHDTENVTVVEVQSLVEQVIGQSEFEEQFGSFVQDETVFYLGSEYAIERATMLLESIEATVKYCIYGKREDQAKEWSGKSNYSLCLQINRLMAGDGELSN